MKTTYHHDHTVTIWNVYNQSYVRVGLDISDCLLASLDHEERNRVMLHIARRAGDEKAAHEYAVKEQGFFGNFRDWLNQPSSERLDYERGAAGIPTA